jgi:murein DD-endopeptidase MepM/ murein hydrolase activator NlpD
MNVYTKEVMQAPDYKSKSSIRERLGHYPRKHIIAMVLLGACLVGVFSLGPNKIAQDQAAEITGAEVTSAEVSLTASPTSLPVIEEGQMLSKAEDPIAPQVVPPKPKENWLNVTVTSGDTLSSLFQRAGLSDRKLLNFMASNKNTKKLTRIHPGQTLDFLLADDELQALRFQENKLNSQLFERREGSFTHTAEQRVPDVRITHRQATINDSLFLAGSQAGLDDNLIMELANIFGWDIDFALDIRKGDAFKVVYEEQFLDGKKYSNGNILSAEFSNRGNTYRALRYTDSKGATHYYTPEGATMRKEFLRTPVDLARISSHFNLKRKHPVLNKIRAHKGTDYAASRGTPIKSVGDGKVIHAGRKGGYGNVVIIQHGQTYKTLYAHMSKFGRGIRRGTTVNQGQTIGYVGSTGLATGPHLHYEFYVNGAVRNPVTVKLPKAKSIPNSEKKRFFAQTKPALALLSNIGKSGSTLMAKAPSPETESL